MDPLWASIIITGGGPGFVTSCWKYFVDANFETENFEWKIYVPGGDWTHVPLTEWYTYTWGVCLTSRPQEQWSKPHTETIYRSLKSQSTHPLLFKPQVLSELEFTYIHSLDSYTSPDETHPGSDMADKYTLTHSNWYMMTCLRPA